MRSGATQKERAKQEFEEIVERLYREIQISESLKTLFIMHQICRDRTVALEKCKKADTPGRRAEGRHLIREWTQRKSEFTHELRLGPANFLRAAAMQAFPTKPKKWVKFHDTRYSYAIELGQAGVSLFQFSQQLGILERTCARHYLGFMSSAEATEMIEVKITERFRMKNAK